MWRWSHCLPPQKDMSGTQKWIFLYKSLKSRTELETAGRSVLKSLENNSRVGAARCQAHLMPCLPKSQLLELTFVPLMVGGWEEPSLRKEQILPSGDGGLTFAMIYLRVLQRFLVWYCYCRSLQGSEPRPDSSPLGRHANKGTRVAPSVQDTTITTIISLVRVSDWEAAVFTARRE